MGLGRERARTASQECGELPGDSILFLSPVLPSLFPALNLRPTLFSFLLLSSLHLSLPQGNEELCDSSRMDQRFFRPRRLVGDSQGTEPGGHPQILCLTKETHSLKGLRKQCIQWTIMMADGRSGSPGPIAWTQPVGDESWTQRISAR